VGWPADVAIIDTMMGIPDGARAEWYSFFTPQLKDAASQTYDFPAQHLFKDVPADPSGVDFVEHVLREMDRYGIARALVGWNPDGGEAARAVAQHPDRFVPTYFADPNRGMDAVRAIRHAHDEVGIKAVDLFPAGYLPQVPIDDRKAYLIYGACCDLGLPVTVTCGVPGPRLPMACQHVELIDQVMYDFPDLVFVMKHGAEPWVDLAVKLMLKWPNLHYATSAFAPRHYPRAIIDYANTRGADRVLYAGYFPMGLSLERIFRELPEVPLRDDVWPKFLSDNARRIFRLD
jgi:predicted TIM-barrel fold metal-dependent hydrolase